MTKKFYRKSLGCAVLCCLSGNMLAASVNLQALNQQALLDSIAAQTEVSFQINANVGVADCQRDVGSSQCYAGTISLDFKQDITLDNWQIYFSNTSNIKWDDSELFDIQHTNGDIHIISAHKHATIKKGHYAINFKGLGSLINESQAFPNYFIVADELHAKVLQSTVPKIDAASQLMYSPHVLPFTQNKQIKRSQSDNVPLASPQWLYDYYNSINALEPQASKQSELTSSVRLIPQSKQNHLNAEQSLDLSQGINVTGVNNSDLKFYQAALGLFTQKGISQHAQGVALNWQLTEHIDLPKQGYQLTITQQDVQIVASDKVGLFYGMVSLSQLIDEQKRVPVGSVTDAPRYDFRGLHVDIARNFHSKAFLLTLIEQMAALKINKLHLHLAEDEAWRLEIPGLPELTEVGAFRCYDPLEQNCLMPQLGSGPDRNTPVNGYLSTQDYQDILRFADARFIEVIPSLDMPGHSRAAIKSMEARYKTLQAQELSTQAEQYLLTEFADKSEYRSIQYYNDNTLNPCLDSTYRFVDKVLSELIALHQQAGVPLKRYHIGADETAGAWQGSPACKTLVENHPDVANIAQLGAYFVERVAQLVAQKGIEAAAWDDGLAHARQSLLPKKVQANVWGLLPSGGYNRAHEFVNRGWDTVLSLPDVLYFDFPYQADPKEPGYYWGARNTDSFKMFQFMPDNLPVHAEFWTDAMGNAYQSNEQIGLNEAAKVSGIQAQLWSETVLSDDSANYMLFPRLIAFAERAWTKPAWAVPYQQGRIYSHQSAAFNSDKRRLMYHDWVGFSRVLSHKILPSLAQQGILFRLPTPGAKIDDGWLYANVMYPGLVIEYKQENSQQWRVYSQPIKSHGKVELRSRLSGFSRVSRTVSVLANTAGQE